MDQRLIQAAWNGDVDYLLNEIDTDPFLLHSMALEGGQTPLHIACLAGKLSFAATVIQLRHEFANELNQDGFSPLHIAAACGHIEIVKELLKVDLGLCLIEGKDRRISLHLAVIKGRVEVIRELVSSSSDSVECMTAQGETCLHLAVKNNQFKGFQVLMHHLKQVHKEDVVNFKDFHGNTILHLAVSRKQYEVVDFLPNGEVISKEKIELNSLNKSGLTPLDMLLMFQSEAGDREIDEILVQAGALKAENLQSTVHTHEERPNHPDTIIRENPISPSRKLLDYFKYNNLKDSPSKVRNTLLVIVILITAATYQPALSPPGGTWQDDYRPASGNSTAKNNSSTPLKPHTAGETIMVTHNPTAYTMFLCANSVGFYMSLYMIEVLTAAFPLRWELRISLYALSMTYSTCMNAIAPDSYIKVVFIGSSVALPFMIPIMNILFRNYFNRCRYVSVYASQGRV